jgi:hypothetical protein
MAGLGTSGCSGGCSDTGVTVKSWCRIALDLRWMVEDEEPRADRLRRRTPPSTKRSRLRLSNTTGKKEKETT